MNTHAIFTVQIVFAKKKTHSTMTIQKYFAFFSVWVAQGGVAKMN